MNQVAKQAGAYLWFPWMGYKFIAGLSPSIKFTGTHLHAWVERGTVRVKSVFPKNTAQCLKARAQTCTNHEASAPGLKSC